MVLPVGGVLVFLLGNGFHLFAECGLACQVFLFLGAQLFEVLLVALVDDGRGSLEACPNLLAQLLGHGAYLAILLVELLQLVESADGIGLVGELLCSFAEQCLLLQVLLEIILAQLAVEVEQVIILLDIELVVAPQLVGLLGGHCLDVFPFLLERLEVVVRLVGLFG